MKKIIITALSISALTTNAFAEDLKPAAWVPLPAVGSSPETGFQYGAYVMRIFPQTEQNVPQNRLELLLQGTTKGQFQAYVWPNVYFDGGNWQVKGKLGGKYWPADYFGQGITQSDDGDKYSDSALETSITVNRKTTDTTSIGASVFAEFHTIENITEDPIVNLLGSNVTGFEGGFYNGIGLSGAYDTRDNIDWPTQGNKLTAELDLFNALLGSDYDFSVMRFAASQYIPMGDDVVALSSRLTSASDSTPFTHLTKPTGDGTLRGGNGNRWIDNAGLGLQGEYRATLSPKWAAVVFVDTFQTGATVADLDFSDLHYSTGLGIRFGMTPDRFNVRVDVGWVDSESVNFAITVGEAF